MKNRLKSLIGPSTLVTAAFIGPGTVTVCTLAGVRSGYMLLWALLFSVIATVVLQEMTGRLGIVSRHGFGEAIRTQISHPSSRWAAILLVMSAIVVGNIAYEGGNISGATLGWEEIFGRWDWQVGRDDWLFSLRLPSLLIGAVAFMLLYHGSFQRILFAMTALVGLMSVVFVTTAVVVQPELGGVLRGLLIPDAGPGEFLTVIALVGTTVVPYNLFLHASVVRERYTNPSQMREMRQENAAGIVVGGLISMCIVITSAVAFDAGGLTGNGAGVGSGVGNVVDTGVGNGPGTGQSVTSAADMARQLEPLLGGLASWFMGIGLFAAGITSAVTAPLAAAFAANGLLGWGDSASHQPSKDEHSAKHQPLKDKRFRFVWMVVLLAGVLFSSLSYNPVRLIEFAQVANGITLPFVAVFLLYLMNRKALMGGYRNSAFLNIAGFLIVLVAFLVGFRGLNAVFGIF